MRRTVWKPFQIPSVMRIFARFGRAAECGANDEGASRANKARFVNVARVITAASHSFERCRLVVGETAREIQSLRFHKQCSSRRSWMRVFST